MFPPETKILVVDDMGMFRQMVKDALHTLEFKNYSEATNGESALTMITDAFENKVPYQLIICDWNMPKMSGIELLKNVRKTSWGIHLPFILLTGVTEKNNILEAIENKVSQYLVKPFSVQGLKEKLEIVHAKAKAQGFM